jgi:DNA-binding LacI/PurR family transcriptional regulator
MPSRRTAARRIVVLAPETGGFYMGDVLAGIDEVCAQQHTQLVVVQTAVSWQASIFDRAPFAEYFGLGRSHRLGVIAVTATMNPNELAILAQIDEPMVTVAGPHPRPGGTSIVIDNEEGAAQAVRHLVSHGHRRIGFVGAFVQHDIGVRYRGYLAALEEAGIEPDEALCYAVHSDLSPGGREAASAILAAGVPLSAIFVSTDMHAEAIMSGLQEAGVRIPDDVAIVAFDDSELAQTTVPPLTSVRQLPHVLGSEAAKTLLAMGAGAPGPEGAHMLPTALVVRHSCGCFETPQSHFEAAHDWNAPDWQARLREVLVQVLAAPAELNPSSGSADIWPGADLVIRAFDAAVRGLPASNVADLDEAWREAIRRTRNAETLLGLVDLLEFVGLCRQSSGNMDPDAIRPRLRGFLAQARLQILRCSAIADPLRHPQAAALARDLARAFLALGPRGAVNLDWLHLIDATRGCLALWEPNGAGGQGRMLRVSGVYGASSGSLPPGALIAPEDFPPTDWIGGPGAGRETGTVTILPIVTPNRDWGILAAVLPSEHRYYDGYWGLQYGASMMALVLERVGTVG